MKQVLYCGVAGAAIGGAFQAYRVTQQRSQDVVARSPRNDAALRVAKGAAVGFVGGASIAAIAQRALAGRVEANGGGERRVIWGYSERIRHPLPFRGDQRRVQEALAGTGYPEDNELLDPVRHLISTARFSEKADGLVFYVHPNKPDLASRVKRVEQALRKVLGQVPFEVQELPVL